MKLGPPTAYHGKANNNNNNNNSNNAMNMLFNDLRTVFLVMKLGDHTLLTMAVQKQRRTLARQ